MSVSAALLLTAAAVCSSSSAVAAPSTLVRLAFSPPVLIQGIPGKQQTADGFGAVSVDPAGEKTLLYGPGYWTSYDSGRAWVKKEAPVRVPAGMRELPPGTAGCKQTSNLASRVIDGSIFLTVCLWWQTTGRTAAGSQPRAAGCTILGQSCSAPQTLRRAIRTQPCATISPPGWR